jgi:hypothetical protein
VVISTIQRQKSGTTMLVLASAAQRSAQTTFTGITRIALVYANPSPVLRISTGTLIPAVVNA